MIKKDICVDLCESENCNGCPFKDATKEQRENGYYDIVLPKRIKTFNVIAYNANYGRPKNNRKVVIIRKDYSTEMALYVNGNFENENTGEIFDNVTHWYYANLF